MVAVDAEPLSEVKGMYSRCVRQDQWDWRAVRLALGEPPHDVARESATKLGKIASALRNGEAESARATLAEMASPDFAHLIEDAVSTIAATAQPIGKVWTLSIEPRRHRRDVECSTVMSTRTKAKLDAANATHTELLVLLGTFLSSHGYRVEANQFVDAFARLKSGPAIFEARA